MSVPINYQATTEGYLTGLITAYEKIHPNCTKSDIIQFLRQFDISDLEYWIEWFGLNK